MSGPPPDDLMRWSKRRLVRELQRLRAVMREHADQPHDPATSGGDLADPTNDPHGRHSVVLDLRGAVLMDSIDVALVDTKEGEPPRMAMMLAGRVNYAARRTKQMFTFGADGAAALVSQLVGLAARDGGAFAAEFQTLLEERMKEMP